MSEKGFFAVYSKFAAEYLEKNNNRLLQDSSSDPGPIMETDAWLLLAIYCAGKNESDHSLEAIIGWGDAINHSVFTDEQLRGGFARLQRLGYIACHGAESEVTQAFEKIWQQAGIGEIETYLEQMDALEKLLGAAER
jgi:hypothetical protein